MMMGSVLNSDKRRLSVARLKNYEVKQRREFEKILVEKADNHISRRLYQLREKKLEYLRNVCDPKAEYETKTQTIDRFIENDYLYFGSSRNKMEKEIYQIKTACK